MHYPQLCSHWSLSALLHVGTLKAPELSLSVRREYSFQSVHGKKTFVFKGSDSYHSMRCLHTTRAQSFVCEGKHTLN